MPYTDNELQAIWGTMEGHLAGVIRQKVAELGLTPADIPDILSFVRQQFYMVVIFRHPEAEWRPVLIKTAIHRSLSVGRLQKNRRSNNEELVEGTTPSLGDRPPWMEGSLRAADARQFENRQLIEQLFRLLTPREAQIVRMHYENELPFAQIECELGLAGDSAHTIYKRALKKMAGDSASAKKEKPS